MACQQAKNSRLGLVTKLHHNFQQLNPSLEVCLSEIEALCKYLR